MNLHELAEHGWLLGEGRVSLRMRKIPLVLAIVSMAACGDSGGDTLDGGLDGAVRDAAPREDAGDEPDVAEADAAEADAAEADSASPVDDAETALDAGELDAGELDAGELDAGDAELDAAATDAGDAELDGSADANVDAATCPTTLLTGGSDVAAQGWLVVQAAPAALTYETDLTRIATSTNPGGRTSGQLLIYRPNTVTLPFAIRIEARLVAANDHNALDSGAAILAAFSPSFGNSTERAAMIYLDGAAVGWADNTQTAAVNLLNGQFHTYEVAVDAQGSATVSVDGSQVLTRSGFTTNGTIAIGDQTNDPNVDGTLEIRSVVKLCR